MTQVVDTAEDRASELRNALTDKLRADGMITSSVVEAAFRRVPRHAFVPPETPLEVTYSVDASIVTKRDDSGLPISSISAAYIQVRMIEQAQVAPGMTVLEVGSGGYNAALLAEVVGPGSRVVSVDIDQEVIERARALLAATGYGDRVEVVLADAAHPVRDPGTFDGALITVGAWDIAPVWLDQLAPDGTLVVPLIMNGVTRTIGFRRADGHLASTSVEVAGFVPLQGDGAHPERVFVLPDAQGHEITLRFDVGAPSDPSLLDGVLETERVELWSGVTTPHGVSFADLYLWFACHLPGFCRVVAGTGTDLAAEPKTWFPFGAVCGGSFAYLAVRPALAGGGVEFGTRAYGNGRAGTVMLEQIQVWDRHARDHQPPTFGYWPAGTDRSRLPAGAVVMEKDRGLVTISWPATD